MSAAVDVARLEAALPARCPALVVAFSGGLDSTVLLHLAAQGQRPVRAVHVHHGLQPAADDWAAHCRATALGLGVGFEQLNVRPDHRDEGQEGGARDARYRALAAGLDHHEAVLTAHHADDQLETLLYRFLRGTGPDGLAGIAPLRPLGRGWLVRPLLDVSRDQLAAYAARHALDWVEDPSNASLDIDRNYLRHRVIPVMKARWPGAAAAAGRLADHARGQRGVIAEWLGEGRGPLCLADWRARTGPARRLMLREWIRAGGQPLPGQKRLEAGIHALADAAADRGPVLAWPGGQVRRHGGWLYRLPAALPAIPPSQRLPTGAREADWGDLGVATGLPAAGPLRLRGLHSGERLALAGRPTKPAREVLREHGVVPWWRDRLPVLVDEHDTCLAVAGLGPTREGQARWPAGGVQSFCWRPHDAAAGADWAWLTATGQIVPDGSFC
ncbi:tRNA lysidine(34) synthetase TilS [Spiribacter roseus]|uniref:tRNA(Ile)-lysidine synthase n=2 Tax=Spiribacter roseus TaxID=1855875 RepID=A0ABV3RYK8_9GAMM